MTVVTSLKEEKQLARPGGCAPKLCTDSFVVHNGCLEPDRRKRKKERKKKALLLKRGFLLPIEVNVKFAFVGAKGLSLTVHKKKKEYTQTKTVFFQAKHVFLKNSEHLLPSPGSFVYRINLKLMNVISEKKMLASLER
jgi:hypothetical protein